MHRNLANRGTTRQRRVPEKLKEQTQYKRKEGKAVGAIRRKRHNEKRHKGKDTTPSPQRAKELCNREEKRIQTITKAHQSIRNGD